MNHWLLSLAVLSTILSAAFLSLGFQTDRELRQHNISMSRREYIKEERWINFVVSLLFCGLALVSVNFA